MQGVYLLHFLAPISQNHTAQHYLGYADDVYNRIRQHRKGKGARLTAVAAERGIEFVIARIWCPGDRQLERQLKNRKNSPQLCPFCNDRFDF